MQTIETKQFEITLGIEQKKMKDLNGKKKATCKEIHTFSPM